MRGQLEGVSLYVELLDLPRLSGVNCPCDLEGPGVPVLPRAGLQEVFRGCASLQLDEELGGRDSQPDGTQTDVRYLLYGSSNLKRNGASFLLLVFQTVFISPSSHSKPSVAPHSLHGAPPFPHGSLGSIFPWPHWPAILISKSTLPLPALLLKTGMSTCLEHLPLSFSRSLPPSPFLAKPHLAQPAPSLRIQCSLWLLMLEPPFETMNVF